ncbi:hypothetical protein Areg01_31110 [Actinoplanes regularis]|nr:hypothetical protein Areg01_31110 [Actinoplanes regularis]
MRHRYRKTGFQHAWIKPWCNGIASANLTGSMYMVGRQDGSGADMLSAFSASFHHCRQGRDYCQIADRYFEQLDPGIPGTVSEGDRF